MTKVEPVERFEDKQGFDGAGRELWESHADWWQTHFTEGADPEYEEQILPLIESRIGAATSVLEVGTGEGQVLRRVASAISETQRFLVGVDPSENQITVARARSTGEFYLRSDAASLPFSDASFDMVVACLVFEHILEADAAIAEVARVLRPGGRFLFLLNHPLLQTPNSGWIDDRILMEQYWRIGAYLKEDVNFEEVQKDVFIPFVHRPLSRYVNALISNGLYLVKMDEPAPPEGFVRQAWEYEESSSIPRLLALESVKSQDPLVVSGLERAGVGGGGLDE